MNRRWPMLAALLLVVGCSDDPVQPNEPTAAVSVTDLATGTPIAGVKVVAMDRLTNRPLADPQLTDSNGTAGFGQPLTADTRYLVVGALAWQVHDQGDWLDSQAPDGRPARIVLRSAAPSDGLPRITGQVIDADTGVPLNRVFIGTAPNLAAYVGVSDPGTDVTGPDGTFRVQEIAFAAHPVTGNLVQLDLLFVSRAGYRPRSWVYQHANGDNNLDITDAVIRLTPLAATDTGVLTGVILLNGSPAPNVPVGLGGFNRAKNGYGIPGQVAVTDAGGRFHFTHLATGSYILDPGFALYDGYVSAGGGNPVSFAVTAGDTTEATGQIVSQEIAPLSGNNVIVTRPDSVLSLSWTPVAAAAEYGVFVAGAAVVTTTDTRLDWLLPADLPTGLYRWTVVAVTAGGGTVGLMQKPIWWEVRP